VVTKSAKRNTNRDSNMLLFKPSFKAVVQPFRKFTYPPGGGLDEKIDASLRVLSDFSSFLAESEKVYFSIIF